MRTCTLAATRLLQKMAANDAFAPQEDIRGMERERRPDRPEYGQDPRVVAWGAKGVYEQRTMPQIQSALPIRPAGGVFGQAGTRLTNRGGFQGVSMGPRVPRALQASGPYMRGGSPAERPAATPLGVNRAAWKGNARFAGTETTLDAAQARTFNDIREAARTTGIPSGVHAQKLREDSQNAFQGGDFLVEKGERR